MARQLVKYLADDDSQWDTEMLADDRSLQINIQNKLVEVFEKHDIDIGSYSSMTVGKLVKELANGRHDEAFGFQIYKLLQEYYGLCA